MEKSDLDTLKILEDLIRRVVREELQARDAMRPFPPAGQQWPHPPPPVWGIDIPTNPPGTPA